MARRNSNKRKGKKIVIILILLLIILTAGGILYFKYIKNTENSNNPISALLEEIKEEPKEEIKIYNGNDRSIAVMIDNVGGARPQAGLNDAYMVYEIIVEGEQTRLMALFKGKDLSKVGPIRSSRHYFLDYALENDAIYVHYGWSPKAKSDISSLKVNNINGIFESTKSFWRVKDKLAPHNAVTSTKKILEIAKRKKYTRTSSKESVLNYTTKEVNLEDGTIATNIKLPYSRFYSVTYKYNEETKTYTRYYNDKKKGKWKSTIQKDWVTKEPVTTKNIIVTFAKNTPLNDGSGKDRQNLSNIGTLDGYYITNGKAIKIKCTKTSRKEQTVYKDLQGNKIDVNDGNTFVQIVPLNAKVTIE